MVDLILVQRQCLAGIGIESAVDFLMPFRIVASPFCSEERLNVRKNISTHGTHTSSPHSFRKLFASLKLELVLALVLGSVLAVAPGLELDSQRLWQLALVLELALGTVLA